MTVQLSIWFNVASFCKYHHHHMRKYQRLVLTELFLSKYSTKFQSEFNSLLCSHIHSLTLSLDPTTTPLKQLINSFNISLDLNSIIIEKSWGSCSCWPISNKNCTAKVMQIFIGFLWFESRFTPSKLIIDVYGDLSLNATPETLWQH